MTKKRLKYHCVLTKAEEPKMNRTLLNELILWKNSASRLPLIVRGARQVGKTYLITQFGTTHFQAMVTLNFELNPKLKTCFDSLEPDHILKKLELFLDVTITPETLLFLDEIQECPNAIMALRYFKEKKPAQAVIAAGSLLEFALEEEAFRMPVGRVKQLFLHPLSFIEFLEALGKQEKKHYLQTLSLKTRMDPDIHKEFLQDLRLYLIIGGMPAVIQEYLTTHSLKSCASMQNAISSTYRNDFGKYATHSQIHYLTQAFDQVPRLIGHPIKYSNIDPGSKSRDLKQALKLLIKAKIITPVYANSAAGIPLGATYSETIFKLLWTDVGLLQNLCGLETDILDQLNLLKVNRGSITEQFVGQELLALRNPEQDLPLFFWKRETKNSHAEIDYLMALGSKIIPIEVKSGSTGSLKSLHLFMKEKQSPIGIRLSEHPLSVDNSVLSVPLYMCSELTRLLDSEFSQQKRDKSGS